MNDIMKIIQALENSNILIKGLIFINRKRNCKSWFRKTMGFLIPPHPLTNFEIQKYYKNELRFNSVFFKK